ncbi:MAG: metal ABC transporter solute-binding protein, Zn/Mn family [Mastigocoleus sp.]
MIIDMFRGVLANIGLHTLIIIFIFPLLGCSDRQNVADKKNTKDEDLQVVRQQLPSVVATTNIVCSFLKQIAEETINLNCLIPPNTDPYSYQPQAKDKQAIESAKVIFYNGYNLEQNLINIIRTQDKPIPKIAVAEIAIVNPRRLKLNGGSVVDPHVWHDVRNAIQMVDIISSSLNEIFPENAAKYTKNAEAISKELEQLDAWIKARVASIPSNQRQLVTIHDAMSYYIQAYQFAVKGYLVGINGAEQPSSTKIQQFANNLNKANISTLFPEATSNQQITTAIAKAVNSQRSAREEKLRVSQRLLFTDSLSKTGTEADTYQKMMAANTRTIVEGNGGTYLLFEPKLEPKVESKSKSN